MSSVTSPENLRYSVEIGRDDQHLEEVVARVEDLTTAWAIFDLTIARRPEKLVLLCQSARILRRSDRL